LSPSDQSAVGVGVLCVASPRRGQQAQFAPRTAGVSGDQTIDRMAGLHRLVSAIARCSVISPAMPQARQDDEGPGACRRFRCCLSHGRGGRRQRRCARSGYAPQIRATERCLGIAPACHLRQAPEQLAPGSTTSGRAPEARTTCLIRLLIAEQPPRSGPGPTIPGPATLAISCRMRSRNRVETVTNCPTESCRRHGKSTWEPN
jgi:hypothetical protein